MFYGPLLWNICLVQAALFILILSIFMIKILKFNLKEKTGKKDLLKKLIYFSLVILGVILSAKQ